MTRSAQAVGIVGNSLDPLASLHRRPHAVDVVVFV
jgi:hypothetical protein